MSGIRVLVIDDSLTIRKLVEIALRGSDHTVDYAATGRAGIVRAVDSPPDLVLCDYVLPDMKGIEVCREIAGDERSKRCAIVVMSGKSEQIRPEFKDLEVLAFLSKPFTVTAITSAVAQVAQQRKPTFGANRETAQALASSFRGALYEVLCDRLARIPSWANEIGSEVPATFYARRLFTEQVLAQLFEELLPIYARTKTRIRDKQLLAQGSLKGIRPAQLLELAVKSGATSEMAIQTETGVTTFYATGNRVYAATPPGATTPLTPAGLTELMRGQDGDFSWRRLALLPPDIGEHSEVPLAQIQLECLRAQVDLPLPSLDVVFARAHGFSDRVRQLSLTGEEQRLLTLVDGTSTVDAICGRAELAHSVGRPALARLSEIGLLRAKGGNERPSDGYLVLVIEPDELGFRDPLAHHLAARHPNVGMLSLDGGTTVEAMVRQRPRMVIINATHFGALALETAQVLMTRRDLDEIRLVAVLEAPAPLEQDLVAAGCDAVLIKPVHVLDLEWMLGGRAVSEPMTLRRGTA